MEEIRDRDRDRDRGHLTFVASCTPSRLSPTPIARESRDRCGPAQGVPTMRTPGKMQVFSRAKQAKSWSITLSVFIALKKCYGSINMKGIGGVEMKPTQRRRGRGQVLATLAGGVCVRVTWGLHQCRYYSHQLLLNKKKTSAVRSLQAAFGT